MFEYDKHYQVCNQNNRPFIKARLNPANGNYFVQIDLMPCNYNFSEKGKKNLKNLFESEIDYSKLNNFSKSSIFDYSVDKELSWVDGIAPMHLKSFCECLFDLSQKYSKEKIKI